MAIYFVHYAVKSYKMENDKTKESSAHLKFIYNRLVNVHKENPLLDYMHKFKTIIEDIKKQESKNINNMVKYKTLTHCGLFVDVNLLGKGIYITNTPTLYSEETTMITLINNFNNACEIAPNVFKGEYLKNLKECQLVDITLNPEPESALCLSLDEDKARGLLGCLARTSANGNDLTVGLEIEDQLAEFVNGES